MSTHRKSLLLRNVKTLADDCRVDSFRDVTICLLQKFSDQQDNRSSSISNLIILGNSSPSDHSSGGILDLHFREEDLAVLGHFNLTRAIDKHLKGTPRT